MARTSAVRRPWRAAIVETVSPGSTIWLPPSTPAGTVVGCAAAEDGREPSSAPRTGWALSTDREDSAPRAGEGHISSAREPGEGHRDGRLRRAPTLDIDRMGV